MEKAGVDSVAQTAFATSLMTGEGPVCGDNGSSLSLTPSNDSLVVLV